MIGVEAPAIDEEVDHARGGGLRGGEGVGAGLDYDPLGVAGGVGWRGLDDRTGDGARGVESEPECGVSGTLHSVDTDFAVALGGVGVAAGEECAGVEDGEIKGGTRGEFADVHVSAEGAGRAGAMGAGLRRGDTHDAAEGVERDDGGSEGSSDVLFELPVEEKGVGEALIEEAETGDDGAPGPAFVGDVKDIDLEGVAGLGVVDVDGAGEGVDAGTVDGEEVVEGGMGGDLGAGGVNALEVNGVAGGDGEARREGGVPEGVGGFGGEDVGGHGWVLKRGVDFDNHLELDEGVAGQG